MTGMNKTLFFDAIITSKLPYEAFSFQGNFDEIAKRIIIPDSHHYRDSEDCG